MYTVHNLILVSYDIVIFLKLYLINIHKIIVLNVKNIFELDMIYLGLD